VAVDFWRYGGGKASVWVVVLGYLSYSFLGLCIEALLYIGIVNFFLVYCARLDVRVALQACFEASEAAVTKR